MSKVNLLCKSSQCELAHILSSFDKLEKLYRANCCDHKPLESEVNSLKGQIIEIYKTHQEQMNILHEKFLARVAEMESREKKMIDKFEQQAETHRKKIMSDAGQVVKKLDLQVSCHAQKIKNYAKTIDKKQATIDEQNKTIKQLKQRVSKADKQSTKNYNLKVHTEKLKSKVSKQQEEIDGMKECQLCFEPYDYENRKPCVATCVHVFCKVCLTKHTHSNSGCPQCRKR